MTKHLITPTLLSSYSYYKNSQDEQEQKAFDDLMRLIRKEPFEPSEAMKKGIMFESRVQQFCDNIILGVCKEFDTIAEQMSKIVKGGLWQQAVKKDITVRNQDFLLYGKCDVIKEDTIYDIKTTKSYDIGKYNGSTQHLIYMYCSGLPKFAYLICENDKEFYREDYSNSPDVENKIKEHVNNFLSFLDTCEGAKKEYFDKWICKY